MPSSPRNTLSIDWSGIQAAAVTVGVREAARQAAADLPPDEQTRFVERVMKRASRQKWLAKVGQAQSAAITSSPSALSANVRTGAQTVANVLAERKANTRAKLAEYAEDAAEEARTAPQKLKVARAVKDVAAIYGTLWPEKDATGAQINIWGSQVMIDGGSS